MQRDPFVSSCKTDIRTRAARRPLLQLLERAVNFYGVLIRAHTLHLYTLHSQKGVDRNNVVGVHLSKRGAFVAPKMPL